MTSAASSSAQARSLGLGLDGGRMVTRVSFFPSSSTFRRTSSSASSSSFQAFHTKSTHGSTQDEDDVDRCAHASAAAGGATTGTGTAMSAAIALALLATPQPALAETVAVGGVASAFAAYGHYASLLTIAGALAVERVTVTAKPTKEQLDRLVAADSIYGIAGVILLGTGYMRAKYYGKGLEWNLFPPFANSLHNNKTNSTIIHTRRSHAQAGNFTRTRPFSG